MPKVSITWDDRYKEWVLLDGPPKEDTDYVECFMNASVYRQIRAAEKKYDKFQDVLEKFYTEGVEHPSSIRRVK